MHGKKEEKLTENHRDQRIIETKNKTKLEENKQIIPLWALHIIDTDFYEKIDVIWLFLICCKTTYSLVKASVFSGVNCECVIFNNADTSCTSWLWLHRDNCSSIAFRNVSWPGMKLRKEKPKKINK